MASFHKRLHKYFFYFFIYIFGINTSYKLSIFVTFLLQNESRRSEMLAAACAVGVAGTFAAPIGGKFSVIPPLPPQQTGVFIWGWGIGIALSFDLNEHVWIRS